MLHEVGSLGNELLRAGAHATVNGAMSWASGGSFWSGFAVGGLSSLAGSGAQSLGLGGDWVPLISGATGAGAAWATDGDPLGGFMQGLSIGTLNHEWEVMHDHPGDPEKRAESAVIREVPLGEVEVFPLLQTLRKYNEYTKMVNGGVSVLADIPHYFTKQELAWLTRTGRLTKGVGVITTAADGTLMIDAINNGRSWGRHAYNTGIGVVGMMGPVGAATATGVDWYVRIGEHFINTVNWINANGQQWIMNNFVYPF